MENDNNCYPPSSNFTAIDVEYADREQNICQIGLAVVRDLKIVERKCWLIQPPGNYYEETQMRVHGITPADTTTAPSFKQLWPEIQPYLLDIELWAHNAVSVEQPVLEKNLGIFELDGGFLSIRDSRNLYSRPDCPPNKGNGLVQCCMAQGIPCENHHDALADAVMCAKLVIAYIEGHQPDWSNVPITAEELRKTQQVKCTLSLGDFCDYYVSTPSGEEDVFCELASTCEGAQPKIIDVFDKGDIYKESKTSVIDFSRLNTDESNPLYGKKVVLTGIFSFDRKDIEKAIVAMGAKKVPKPTRNTDAVILGTRNVGFTKLCAIEEQEAKGHHIFRIVGDDDLAALLYGDGQKFFQE